MKVFRLSFASVAANFDERTRLHCETDTVQHEPSSFLDYAEGAGKLTGTYAIEEQMVARCSGFVPPTFGS